MNAQDKGFDGARSANENAATVGLPFIVEIWDLPRTAVERMLARADTLAVARAIYNTAISENPSRRVVLRQGPRIIQDHG